jgi:uncharacterized protein YcaQ
VRRTLITLAPKGVEEKFGRGFLLVNLISRQRFRDAYHAAAVRMFWTTIAEAGLPPVDPSTEETHPATPSKPSSQQNSSGGGWWGWIAQKVAYEIK